MARSEGENYFSPLPAPESELVKTVFQVMIGEHRKEEQADLKLVSEDMTELRINTPDGSWPHLTLFGQYRGLQYVCISIQRDSPATNLRYRFHRMAQPHINQGRSSVFQRCRALS